MVRQLKSFAQLHELLLRELQKNTGLKGVHPNLVELPARDETGCNWCVATWSESNGTPRDTPAHLLALVSDLQKRYNAIGKLPLRAELAA